jgi:hypothetical protein
VIGGFAAASLGLALLCVIAARGSYKHGFLQVIMTLLFSGAIGGVLFLAYKRFLPSITAYIAAQPTRMVPVFIAVLWLAAAALLPPPLAIGGLISGLVMKARRRKR